MSHFIVEDGTGHSLANAYATVAFITGYLTDRNRHESSGWTDLDLSVQEAAAIAATDYIENRFRNFFKGRKQYWSLTQALGLLSFTGQPTTGEQVSKLHNNGKRFPLETSPYNGFDTEHMPINPAYFPINTFSTTFD